MKVQQVPEQKPGDAHVVAMLDGKVHLRIHPVDFVMEPDAAEAAGKQMVQAANVARRVRVVAARAPAGLSEEEMIAYLSRELGDTVERR